MNDCYAKYINQRIKNKEMSRDSIAEKYRDLFDYKNTSTYIDIHDIIQRSGIKYYLDDFTEEHLKGIRSISYIHEQTPHISCHSSLTKNEIRFELAHQLGHYLLHMPIETENALYTKCSNITNDPYEIEANNFAINLLCHPVPLEYWAQEFLSDKNVIDILSKYFGLTKSKIIKQLREYNMM